MIQISLLTASQLCFHLRQAEFFFVGRINAQRLQRCRFSAHTTRQQLGHVLSGCLTRSTCPPESPPCHFLYGLESLVCNNAPVRNVMQTML